VLVFSDTCPMDYPSSQKDSSKKTSKLLGSKDVQLGLPELDPKLMVKARNIDEVREWANRENVAAGLERLTSFKTFRI